MNIIKSKSFVLPVLIFLGLAVIVKPVFAGIEAECSQEAEEYGVMPELRIDYINGCIESRGGTSTLRNVESVDVPPSDSGDSSSPAVDKENVAE